MGANQRAKKALAMLPPVKTGIDTSNYATQPRKLTREIMQYTQIPESLWRVRLDLVPESVKPFVTNILRNINSFVNRGVNVVIAGEMGVGKSSVAALFGFAARQYRFGVYFTSYRAIRDAYRAGDTVWFDPQNQITLFQRLVDVRVLIIDDVTEEDLDDKYYGAQVLIGLIAKRASRNLSTYVTTRVPFTAMTASGFPSVLTSTIPNTVSIEVIGKNKTLAQNLDLFDQLTSGIF